MAWKKTDNLSDYGILLTSETKKIPLGNENLDYEIYKIPLEKLKYNSNNGRIFMEMARLKSDVDIVQLEKENVTQFNAEIENLIWNTAVEKNESTLADIYKFTQLESGVVLDDGTVIDGNRRFTCLRRLHEKYPDNDDFKYLKAAIIFRDGNVVTAKDIKKYELRVQFGRDEKVDYNAVNFAMSLYQEIKSKTFSIQEIAENVNKKINDVTKMVQTCELIEDFLMHIGRPGQLYVAEALNIYWPLEPLAAYLNGQEGKKLSEIDKNKRKTLFFNLLLSINVQLTTQEFRDNLIKKIFKNEKYFDLLSQAYDDVGGKDVNDKILCSTSDAETFVGEVKDFKGSETGEKIHNSYKNIVEKINMESQVNAPIELCEKIKEILSQIDIKPYINSSSSKADQVLTDVRTSLSGSKQLIDDIVEKIVNKIENNE